MAGRCYGIPRPQSSRPPCSNCSADRTTHPSRTRGPARATNILARTPCKPGGRVEWSGTSEETTLLMSVQDGGGWARDPIRAAGGRRRYNADRQIRARLRQVEVVKLLLAWPFSPVHHLGGQAWPSCTGGPVSLLHGPPVAAHGRRPAPWRRKPRRPCRSSRPRSWPGSPTPSRGSRTPAPPSGSSAVSSGSTPAGAIWGSRGRGVEVERLLGELGGKS